MCFQLILTVLCFLAMMTNWIVVGDPSMEKFQSSTCDELLKTVDSANLDMMQSILPTPDFWDFFTNRTTTKRNLLLVDVDKNSVDLLLNQIVALRKTGSDLANHVYATAYDDSTCDRLRSAGLSCYYNAGWQERLFAKYKEQTLQDAHQIHVVMMGRMMTTVVALCEGHNVHLTDTDVVYYRDPMDYPFHEAGIMITATKIPAQFINWGGRFFPDQPNDVFTLNNGVVFYRSTPIVKSFSLTLVINSVRKLKFAPDPQQGFMQIAFNELMSTNKLVLHPTSKISDPTTFRLNNPQINNTIGECYDCYHGHFPWTSDVVRTPVVENHPEVLKIGVFPLRRYTSFCTIYAGMNEDLLAASSALNHNDSTHWQYGALENSKSRVLFTHSNCMFFSGESKDRFKIKSDWFHQSNSWFL